MSSHITPMSLGYHPDRIVGASPDTHLITAVVTLAIEGTTMMDPIVMIGDPTVTIVGHIGTIGIETDLIATTEGTATIISTIGTTTLTIARGVGLAIVPEITAAAGTKTRYLIMRAACP
jgi:hypothetical protein